MKYVSFKIILKKILVASLLVFIGIIVQNKYEVIQKIIDLEDSLFHQEEYEFLLKLVPVNSSKNIMGIQSKILNSYGEYSAEILIPVEYNVSNKSPLKGTVEKNGYYTYSMSSFRKQYRDLCGYDGFLITPRLPNLPKQPIIIAVVLKSEVKFLSEEYSIETVGQTITLTHLNGDKKVTKNDRCSKTFS